MPENAVIERVLIPQSHGGSLVRFPQGVTGNPYGRQSAGLSVLEHYNALKGTTEPVLRRIAKDRSETPARRVAAKSWLRALHDGYFNATPLAANDLDRIFDRTEGRPTQRIETAKVERPLVELLAELAALLVQFPHLAAKLPGLLPADIVLPALPLAPTVAQDASVEAKAPPGPP